jgi:hypothetical protein
MRSSPARFCVALGHAIFAALLLGIGPDPAIAQNAEIAKPDTFIEMAAGNSKFTDDNVVLFLQASRY